MEGWVRDLQPDLSWWGGHRVGRPRKPMISSTLPPFSPPYPGSRILQPPVWHLHPCLSHLDAMHLSPCTGSLLGTASSSALLNMLC